MSTKYDVQSVMQSDMQKKIEQAYLYDFYGELLNDHQRSVYEAFVFNDLSLGEIAKEEGISRQGVHDMVKRCDRTLASYEEKLHLVARFQQIRDKVGQIQQLTHVCTAENQAQTLQHIEHLSNEILEEL